jgi:guanine deaminase
VSTSHPKHLVFLSNFINPNSDKKASLILNGAMILKRSTLNKKVVYKIQELNKENKLQKTIDSLTDVHIFDLSTKIILPSFFDMHFHWVQDDVRTMPKASLLDWLKNYTWPYEAKFKDKKYSKDKAKYFFQRLAKAGTLGGACYSSIHDVALKEAFNNVRGDFIIGNVLMTMNSPEYLTQTKKNALSIVKKYSTKFKKRYALTPRFAPTTHPDVMKESAKIARKNQSFMQTHLSETPDEIDYVLSLYKNIPGFEKVKTYTEIYKKSGMLGPKTIMGHGIYLNKQEKEILSKTKTKIAHCPTSNAPVKKLGLGSGLFDYVETEKAKIEWALASDIGGGPFLSMFDVMNSFVEQNKKKYPKKTTYTKALYRSTVSGAKMLNLEKTNGNLESGKWANFIVLNMPKVESSKITSEQLLEKIIKSKSNKRSEYDQMPQQVFYQGIPV